MARQCLQGKFVSGGKGNAPPGIQILGVKFNMEGLRQMAKNSESNSLQFDESLFMDDISLTVEPDTSEDNSADLMLPDYLLYILISLDWDYMFSDNNVPYWHLICCALQEYEIDLLEIVQQNLWILDEFQAVLPNTLTTDTLVVILSHITEEASMSDEHIETHHDDSHLPSEYLEVRCFLEEYLDRNQFFSNLTNKISNVKELTELENQHDTSDLEDEDVNSDSRLQYSGST